MSPAERKFMQVEATLMRARCLSHVLRHATETGFDIVDDALWDGVHATVAEIEASLDNAADAWREAYAAISPKP